MISRYKLYYTTFLIVFWTMSCWGFVVEELLHFLAPLSAPVQLLCDMVLLVLGLLTIRQRGDLVVLGSYIVLAFVSTVIVNGESLGTLFNGSRDFYGLIFIVPILRWFFTCDHDREFRNSFNRQLYYWLIIQAVCITFQFFKYGANDHGGGSMGMGASGLMSMSIYLISFYLVTQNWDSSRYLHSLMENKRYILLLYPSFLNETKVSFILLAAYFLLLVKFDRAFLIKTLYIVPLSIVGFIAVGNIYLNVTGQDADELLSYDYAKEYFYGEDLDFMVDAALMIQDGTMDVDPRDWWTVDIPRFAKPVLMTPILRDETDGGTMLGAGVGHFKGGRVFALTSFAKRNSWLLQGSRPWSFFIYTQLGIIGLIWAIAVVCRDIFVRGSSRPFSWQIQTLIALALFLVLFYNDSLRIFNFCTIVFYMTLSLKYYTPDDSAAQEETNET